MLVDLQTRHMLRWRLRVLMAEKNISNKQLAEISGLHRVTISKLKGVDELGQINGETINSVLNGLNTIYKQRGSSKIITPSDLIEYTPDIPSATPGGRPIEEFLPASLPTIRPQGGR